MNECWSDYWKQGHSDSFSDNDGSAYEGKIKKIWFDFFKPLAEDQSVLDIGTGNGSLISLAQSMTLPSINWVGIDKATLNVSNELQKLNNVNILEEVSAESLPFENGQFDLVISQFGIEYANFRESIHEVSRVLNENGRYCFIVHHADSIIVRSSGAILDVAKEVNKKGGAVSLLKELLEELSRDNKDKLETENLRFQLNNTLSKLQRKDKSALWGTNFPSLFSWVFSSPVNMKEKIEIVRNYENDLKGYIERLAQMSAAAVSPEKIILYKDILHEQGLESVVDVIRGEDEQILGWKINGNKTKRC